MNDELFIELVRQLRQAREKQAEFAASKKAFEENPVYIAICEQLKAASEWVGNAEMALKTQLVADEGYIPPFKAAWLVNATTVSIDEEKALAWAKVNMAAAVSEVVDKKMLTDFAKNNPKSAPYATITEGKDARIASDLGKFTEIAE